MGKSVPPATVEEFMAQAVAMELEAAQRYGELADTMEVHHNLEVGALFRKMETIEGKHAAQLMAQMGWKEPPQNVSAPVWDGFEAAESVPHDALHYRMQPWHALQLALVAEQRAAAFFDHLVNAAPNDAVRAAAQQLLAEEREHVELIKAWIARVPPPDPNWDEDPDPPRFDH